MLSPLLFIIALEALTTEFCVGLPWELFYAHDLCLIAETEEELVSKIKRWKEGMESKGLIVDAGKTKVMCCKVRSRQVEDCGRWPCAECRKGVGVNSISCTRCGKWVHKRCSGLTGSLNAVVDFECGRCVEGTGDEEGKKEIEIEHVGKLECVDKFCYLQWET